MPTEFIPKNNKILEFQFNLSFPKKKEKITCEFLLVKTFRYCKTALVHNWVLILLLV